MPMPKQNSNSMLLDSKATGAVVTTSRVVTATQRTTASTEAASPVLPPTMRYGNASVWPVQIQITYFTVECCVFLEAYFLKKVLSFDVYCQFYADAHVTIIDGLV